MNKIFSFLCIAVMTVLLGSCNDSPFDHADEGAGALSFKNMIVKIDNEQNITRSSVDVGSFIVDIVGENDRLVESYVYSEMPEVVALPAGDYKVNVRSGDVAPVEWEAPYFVGSTEFTVAPKEITEVDTVVCKLSNVKVQVIFSEELKSYMSSDSKVTVEMGEGASIDFKGDETRAAYFAYVEGSNTLTALFTGTVDGDKQESLKAYTNVAPGNFYKITFSYHNASIPENEGQLTFRGINVDATVTVENLSLNVDPDDDYLDDDLRPEEGNIGGGSDPGQGGNDPVTPGGNNAPQVTVNAPYSFDAVNDVSTFDASSDSLVIDVTSETGFTTFKVVIDSPTLTSEILEGVGLTTDLDLINPGSFAEGLQGLGLPINVGGHKKETVDISQFVPLLSIYGAAVHNFVVTVSDANGTTVKTLKLETK